MLNHCKSYNITLSPLLLAATLLLLLPFCTLHATTHFKKIALLGDSMTWIGGDSCQNPTGWSHYLKKSCIADSIEVYARSGATWTNTSDTRPDPDFYSEVLHDNNVIFNQVLRLISTHPHPSSSPSNPKIVAKRKLSIPKANNQQPRSIAAPSPFRGPGGFPAVFIVFQDCGEAEAEHPKSQQPTTAQPCCASSPDLIIIFAGANDAWFSSHRPGIFNPDTLPQHSSQLYNLTTLQLQNQQPTTAQPRCATSLHSSVILSCDLLRAHFPNARLVIVTPLQMSKVPADRIHKVSDIIEKAALSRGCLVLRADNLAEINHDDESKSTKYTYDGVHTNPAGARLLADFIIPHLLPPP